MLHHIKPPTNLPPHVAQHPPPEGIARQKLINEAAGILGDLYIAVTRAGQTPTISNEALDELGRRVGSQAMIARRRLRKAASV